MLKNALERLAFGASSAVAVLVVAVLVIGPINIAPALAHAFSAEPSADHLASARDLSHAQAPAHNASWHDVMALSGR